ncbi:fimbria/pilus outer membrane usher protein [Burkholderia ubonensis]|uniref:fimbria/pilus outer membrane usher protein n=1 Tax=Burkholderia ubonensis TaxID=101571 RepID=UPI0009B45CB9|nr:fimbria/pilus outer membrane usher protein [Burkholderia ubonensis]
MTLYYPGRRFGYMRERPPSSFSRFAMVHAAVLAAWHVTAHARDATETTAAEATQAVQTSAFDPDALRARGIDPALAAYFSQAPRFAPGIQRVTLFVNDERRGAVAARFNDAGTLCFDRALVERAGLVVPGTLARRVPAAADGDACYDYREAFPQTVIELDPGAGAVRLVAPAEAVAADSQPVGQYASGGVGGIVNYNVVTTGGVGQGASGDYLLGDGELGFNAGDWIVRSRNSVTRDSGKVRLDPLYTYAQKTFAETGAMLQAGEINVNGGLFPVPSIIGAQFFPDSALVPVAAGPSFQGIAERPARIELRQLGALVYATVVPAGPFTLKNLPLSNPSADLEITMIETDGGATRRYTVPAASLVPGQRAPLGLAVAVGKVRRQSGGGEAPLVATVSKGWAVGTRYRVAGGALVSPGYQAVATSVDATILRGASTNVTAIASNAQNERARGVSVAASVGGQLTERLSGSISATQQTQQYRTLSDTTGGFSFDGGAPVARFRSQYTASAAWSSPMLGGFALSYSYGSNFHGPSTQYATLGWNRMFGRVTASVNLQRDIGRRAGTGGGMRMYATLSVPIGRATVQGFGSNSGGQMRFGTSVAQTVNDYVSYNARAETNPNADGPNLSAGLSVLPRYTQASFSYAQSGWRSGSYMARVQGGIAATREGVTFSPYEIGDTFGVVTTGNLSGVRISTPQGTVWTDRRGRAVVPQLPAYQRSRIEVSTKSLPRNADLANGIEFLDAGRGSVNFVGFGVVKTRRVLLRVTMADGSPIATSLPVLDATGQYVATSVGDGVVFLDQAPVAPLSVKLGDGGVCRLSYTLPEHEDASRPFDSANATCVS